jgi:hypothetical protein
MATRIKGRQTIERTLRRALIQAGRFSQHRANTDDDRWWIARVIDAVRPLVRPQPNAEPNAGQPRSTWEHDA